MKCVAYSINYPGGSNGGSGGDVTLHDLLRTLVVAGWDAEVLLQKPSCASDYIIDGVQVRAFTDVKQPNRAIPDADLVIAHLGTAQRGSLIARQHGIPSIHIVHNDLDYTKAMSRHASRLVYNTLWVADSFRDSGALDDRGIVVHPPVDPSKYLVDSSRRYCTLVNLTHGKTQKYSKGPNIFYELARRFPEEEFLGVLGGYGDQDIRDGYPNVTFMDNTDDAREFYSKTKIVLSPSNYESYGRISVEAATSGIPSITSTAPGFAEHGIAASMVDYRDCDGWEAALRELQDPETYSWESKKAEAKAQALWDRSQQELAHFVDTCREVARKMRKPPRRR